MLRHLLSDLVEAFVGSRRASQASRAARPWSNPARVFYGWPAPTGFPSGGLVKVQRLQESFPDNPFQFNVLYLVSSALPLGAAAMVRAARRPGARFVLNQNGVAYPGWEPEGWRHTNRRLAAVLEQADHVLYQSEFCKLASDRFLGPPKGTWETLYNSVDTRMFQPAAVPAPEKPLVLLLGGNQDSLYRFESAVRALRRVLDRGVDAQLLVTGGLRWAETAEADARRLVRELALGDRVELCGPYTQSQAPALIGRAHILLHTKYRDPSPGLVVEALACGLPVVYSRSGGVPELVGEEAGIGVAVEDSWDREVMADPDALADAVMRVSAERARFSAAARRRALDRFDIGPWLARHRDVFSAPAR